MTRQVVSNHLPPVLRDALVRASQTPNPVGDPMARARAIEATVAAGKAQYPNLFKKD